MSQSSSLRDHPASSWLASRFAFFLSQTSLTTSLILILKQHQHHHTSTLEGLKYKLSLVDTSLAGFDAEKDQALFVGFNKRPGFVAPGDWGWEACSSYYDSVSRHRVGKLVVR